MRVICTVSNTKQCVIRGPLTWWHNRKPRNRGWK